MDPQGLDIPDAPSDLIVLDNLGTLFVLVPLDNPEVLVVRYVPSDLIALDNLGILFVQASLDNPESLVVLEVLELDMVDCLVVK